MFSCDNKKDDKTNELENRIEELEEKYLKKKENKDIIIRQKNSLDIATDEFEDLRNNKSLIDSLSKERQIILKLMEENNLRSDLDDIMEQYNNSRNEIDNLNIDWGEIESEIDNLKSEIRYLLNIKNDLKEAKKKIVALQNISKKYFEQVDSLLLKTENL